jgi:hypothetical protein
MTRAAAYPARRAARQRLGGLRCCRCRPRRRSRCRNDGGMRTGALRRLLPYQSIAARTALSNCRPVTGLYNTAAGLSIWMRAIVEGSLDPVMNMTLEPTRRWMANAASTPSSSPRNRTSINTSLGRWVSAMALADEAQVGDHGFVINDKDALAQIGHIGSIMSNQSWQIKVVSSQS